MRLFLQTFLAVIVLLNTIELLAQISFDRNGVLKPKSIDAIIEETLSESPMYSPEVQQAMTMFERLTGSIVSADSDYIQDMAFFIEQGDPVEAALVAMDHDGFYKTTALQFAAPMSNNENSQFSPLNDIQTTILGVIRDETDARELLTGDFRYQPSSQYYWAISEIGVPSSTLSVVSTPNPSFDVAYNRFGLNSGSEREISKFNEFMGTDLLRVADRAYENQTTVLGAGLRRDSPQRDSFYDSEASGLLTTWTFARNNYDAGTNRRAVVAAFNTFMCTDIIQWKVRGARVDRIGVDIPRAPFEDPSRFRNDCRSCHGPMDGFRGAFAHLNFTNGSFGFDRYEVEPKMNNDPHKHPTGHMTTDDSWQNFLVGTHNDWMGFPTSDPNQVHRGIRAFGEEIANSAAFPLCMAKRVFEAVCRKDASVNPASPEVERLSQYFVGDNYNLKLLIARSINDPNCLSEESSQ